MNVFVSVFQLTQREYSDAICAYIANITVGVFMTVYECSVSFYLFGLSPCVHTNRSADLANYTTEDIVNDFSFTVLTAQ